MRFLVATEHERRWRRIGEVDDNDEGDTDERNKRRSLREDNGGWRDGGIWKEDEGVGMVVKLRRAYGRTMRLWKRRRISYEDDEGGERSDLIIDRSVGDDEGELEVDEEKVAVVRNR